MAAKKNDDHVIIDLTNNERFNKFLEKQVRDGKRDAKIMKAIYIVFALLNALLLVLRLCK